MKAHEQQIWAGIYARRPEFMRKLKLLQHLVNMRNFDGLREIGTRITGPEFLYERNALKESLDFYIPSLIDDLYRCRRPWNYRLKHDLRELGIYRETHEKQRIWTESRYELAIYIGKHVESAHESYAKSKTATIADNDIRHFELCGVAYRLLKALPSILYL